MKIKLHTRSHLLKTPALLTDQATIIRNLNIDEYLRLERYRRTHVRKFILVVAKRK